jgi:hypothetical protein
LNYEITQEFIRRVDRGAAEDKTVLAGVLLHQAQTELVILKQMRAKIGHLHPLCVSALDEAGNRVRLENNVEAVRLSKFFGELLCASFQSSFFLLVALRPETIEDFFRFIHQFGGDT